MPLEHAYVFAAMLRVAQPGHSELSRVPLSIEACDIECVSSFQEHRGATPVLDYRPNRRAQWQGWSVRETRFEGLRRYSTIARAIAFVADNPPDGWRWPSRDLADLLVTIARHESAFWRGVQDGSVRGAAGEIGLWQIHPVLGEMYARTRPGVTLDDTIASAEVAAELLTRARRLCGTVEGTIAAYGSGDGCTPEGPWTDGVGARMVTFGGLHRRGFVMGFDARLALLYPP